MPLRARARGQGELVPTVLQKRDHVRVREACLVGDFCLGLFVSEITDPVGDQSCGSGILIGVGHVVSHVVNHMRDLPAYVGVVGWGQAVDLWDFFKTEVLEEIA